MSGVNLRGRASQQRLAVTISQDDLAAAGTADVLDALIALTAKDRPGCEILTSDPDDIYHLLEALHIQRRFRRV